MASYSDNTASMDALTEVPFSFTEDGLVARQCLSPRDILNDLGCFGFRTIKKECLLSILMTLPDEIDLVQPFWTMSQPFAIIPIDNRLNFSL
jgi:hypothetical protein